MLNDGPGKYDDYKPLLQRGTCMRLDPDYRQKLESAFQEDFRLTSKGFRYLVRKLGGSLGTNGGKYPRDFVALTALWHLASGCTYREVCAAMRRGVSKATVMRHVHVFVDGVCEKLNHHIRWPDEVAYLVFIHALNFRLLTFSCLLKAGLAANAESFRRRTGFPHIVGAIDGCHIPVSPPPHLARRYYNYKNFHSIILSGIVDAQGRFLSMDTGFYGRLGDSGCLKHSPIWHESVHGPLFSRLGYYLYGDSAYPLKHWLLKGYPASTATEEQIKFNTRGSRARVIVECSYGKLKGQWRTLHVGLRTESHDLWVNTVHACCILHNITIDYCDQGWSLGDDFSNDLITSGGRNSFDRDPIEVTAAPVALPDDAGAREWRDGLFAQMKTLRDW